MADLLEPTELEKAYAAGLFDGEGCVQLYMRPGDYSKPKDKRTNNSFRSNLSLANVDPTPVHWVKERWGGSFKTNHGPWRQKAGYRACYYLQLTAKDAERFARDIYPYAIVKREQLRLWLVARSMTYERGSHGRPHGGLGEAEVAKRRELVELIRAEKHKEYGHR